jgi:hypothetical protein
MEHRAMKTDRVQQMSCEENLPHSNVFRREFPDMVVRGGRLPDL